MASVVQIASDGGTARLVRADVEPLEPGPSEIRFVVDAYALNQADLLYLNGDHYTELVLPSRIGSEAVGVVDAIGDAVTGISIGDRISSTPFFSSTPDRHGVAGEFAIVPADFAAPWPTGMNAIEATSIWMQYLTAYYAMVIEAGMAPGRSVLVVAGASSAGLAAIETAKLVGASVVATTRSESKRAVVAAAGADHVLVTADGTAFADKILAATDGKPIDVAFDPVAGDFAALYADAMAFGGKVMHYGMLGGDQGMGAILTYIRKKLTLAPYSMYNHVCFEDQRREGIDWVYDRVVRGDLRPRVDRVFSYEDALDAYRYMQAGLQAGKIVVAVSPEAKRHITA